MATRTIVRVEMSDDLDGKQIPEGEGETVRFSVEGREYEIDLNKRNAAKLRDTLAPYVDHARKVAGSTRRDGTRTKTDPSQLKAIRDWAKRSGHKVADRGRISAEITKAYEKAHQS